MPADISLWMCSLSSCPHVDWVCWFRASREGLSAAGQGQTLPEMYPEQPVRNCKRSTTCGCQGWAWEGPSCAPRQAFTITGPGSGEQKSQDIPRPTSLLAACETQALKGPLAILLLRAQAPQSGARGSPEGLAVAFPNRLIAQGGEHCTEQGKHLRCGRWTPTEGPPVALPSAPSPEPQTPVFPHTTLVHSTPPPLEHRVSGYKQHFVRWSFKRVPASLPMDSHLFLADTNPVTFHRQMLRGYLFWALLLWAGEPGRGGVRPHASQGEAPKAEISLWNLGRSPWERGEPSCFSALPTGLDVASSANPWLEDSFQPVFNWLFRVILL